MDGRWMGGFWAGRSEERGEVIYLGVTCTYVSMYVRFRSGRLRCGMLATSKFRARQIWAGKSKLELNEATIIKGYNKSSLTSTMVSRSLALIGAALILGVAAASSSIEAAHEHDDADAGLRRRRLGATIGTDDVMIRQVRAGSARIASGAGSMIHVPLPT